MGEEPDFIDFNPLLLVLLKVLRSMNEESNSRMWGVCVLDGEYLKIFVPRLDD